MFSVELYGRVRHACHVEGLSQREAARRFGIHRGTVRKMLDLPPASGGVGSEYHAAASMVIPSMLALASAGVR
jgi:transposase